MQNKDINQKKYLKYKTKYANLKKKQYGGGIGKWYPHVKVTHTEFDQNIDLPITLHVTFYETFTDRFETYNKGTTRPENLKIDDWVILSAPLADKPAGCITNVITYNHDGTDYYYVIAQIKKRNSNNTLDVLLDCGKQHTFGIGTYCITQKIKNEKALHANDLVPR